MLGSILTNRFTHQRGECVRMTNGRLIGRDSEGRLFVGKSPRGRKAGCKVVVVEGDEDLSGELDAVKVGTKYRITSPDPIWFGCPLNRESVRVLK